MKAMRLALFLLTFSAYGDPSLLLDRAGIARIQQTAAREPWAAQVLRDLIERADDWPAAHVKQFGLAEWALPREGAGWSHAYVCPEHGMRLTQKGGKNLCPVDGKDYHGWPVDNVVYMQRNGNTAAAARDLGLAFMLTGKAVYAQKARRIFAEYAALYPKLPIHDNDNKLDTKRGARVMSQTLSEAGWLVPLAFGYDLVRDAMPAAERAQFEANVLRNAAAVIRRNNAGASNWQSWHNAALLAIGLLVKDSELVTLAMDGPGGFRFQMRESITPDGPWFEGAWGYHFFALNPLLLTREMAVRAGIALPEASQLKKMLDAPLKCVFPDGTLPNFNDSGLTRLAADAIYYDIGYRLFSDRRYGVALKGGRRGVESLLWGAEELPTGAPASLASELLPASGMATLRVRGSDHTLAVKFGPHGGGHGHYDKLTLVSYAHGSHLAADPGTQAYAAKTHGTWDKMTIAHNTIVVDQTSQAGATGSVLEWKPGPGVTAIRISAGAAYRDVQMDRLLVHTADYTLDIATARATDGKEHRFDWIYHNYGKASTTLPLAHYAELPLNNGYQHLTAARAAATSDDWLVDFAQQGSNLRLRMIGFAGTTVVSGQGLGPDLRVPVPFVMARRKGTLARFIALHEPFNKAPSVITVRELHPGVIAVQRASTLDEIVVEPGNFSYTRKPRAAAISLAR